MSTGPPPGGSWAPKPPVTVVDRRSADSTGRSAELLSILLVEDDAGDALLVEEQLADSGLRVTLTVASTLANALTTLRRGFDCVLLDLNLPDTQGLSGLEAILRGAPQSAVLVLTGLADAAAGTAAVGQGAQDYLIKGQVDGPLLGSAIRYAVQRRQFEQTSRVLRETEMRAQENARLERGLLPRPRLEHPNLGIVSRYRPGRERALLGGDFYDVVQVDEHTLHLVIGDVCGHGPDEAALGVLLRSAWRALVLAGVTGPRLAAVMQQMLVAERPRDELYATICMVAVSLDTGVVRTLSAAHPPPLGLVDGRCLRLPCEPGFAIGMFTEFEEWTEQMWQMPTDGGLLLYTDGLMDAHRGTGTQRWGVDGLVELTDGLAGQPPEILVERLLDAVLVSDAGRNNDDLAMLYLHWKNS